MVPLIIAGFTAALPLVAVFGFKKGREQGQIDTVQEQSEGRVNVLALGVGAFLAFKFYKR